MRSAVNLPPVFICALVLVLIGWAKRINAVRYLVLAFQAKRPRRLQVLPDAIGAALGSDVTALKGCELADK